MPIPNPPFRPTDESQVCRGKSGRSKPHAHYRGRNEHRVVLDGTPCLTSRCTSCGQVVVWALDPVTGEALTRNPAVLATERFADLGLAMVAAL